MYCTRRQIKDLIGDAHTSSWKAIRDRIDQLNTNARDDRKIRYWLRRNALGHPFDIQVDHDGLPAGHKQYLIYCTRQRQLNNDSNIRYLPGYEIT